MNREQFRDMAAKMSMSIKMFRALGEDGLAPDQSDEALAAWLIGEGWTKP